MPDKGKKREQDRGEEPQPQNNPADPPDSGGVTIPGKGGTPPPPPPNPGGEG